MGIPFMPMDISDTINGIVNDTIGVKPTVPEPAGPVDITDQCNIRGTPASWGNGGNIFILIPDDYIGYYIEIITGWTPGCTISMITGIGLDDRTDTVNDSNIITKGMYEEAETPPSGVLVQVAIGANINTSPYMISVKVSENEF